MNIARILYPVKVLGPGERVGIWMCGCDRACPGCSNPELWKPRAEYEISVRNAAAMIGRVRETRVIDGVTISGGEPFRQAAELAELLEALDIEDVLIYTGYLLEELTAMRDPAVDRVLSKAAVLIDGPYLREQNDGARLRGSSNQQIHILNESLRPRYERYLDAGENQIQNFTTADGVVSVGIHKQDFAEKMRRGLNP